MHELFYRENILRRIHFTSRKIRHLNSLLVSSDFLEITQEQWNSHLLESYLYPMFPNFSSIQPDLDKMDLETTWGLLPGYKLYNYSEPQLKGNVSFDRFVDLQVIAQSPLFLLGLYPEYFSLQDESKIDLSFMTDRQLVIGVGTDCLFRMGFNKLNKKPSIFSLGLTKSKNRDENCSTYLEDNPSYQHDKLRYNGAIKVIITKNSLAEVKNKMTLIRTDISQLEILIAGEYKTVESVFIDLSNGSIIDFEN